jgi:hypothetical protein
VLPSVRHEPRYRYMTAAIKQYVVATMLSKSIAQQEVS